MGANSSRSERKSSSSSGGSSSDSSAGRGTGGRRGRNQAYRMDDRSSSGMARDDNGTGFGVTVRNFGGSQASSGALAGANTNMSHDTAARDEDNDDTVSRSRPARYVSEVQVETVHTQAGNQPAGNPAGVPRVRVGGWNQQRPQQQQQQQQQQIRGGRGNITGGGVVGGGGGAPNVRAPINLSPMEQSWLDAIKANNIELARDLFQRGVCPLVHDGVGLTAMDYVCILDLPNLVPFLLAALDSYFASPEYLENWRSVPFSSSDYPLTLEDYLNQARYKHWTVLTLAACCGALKICEMLVATGYIDLEALGGCGYSAVCCAIKCALRAEKQLQQSMQNRLNTSAGVKQDAGGAVVAQRRMRDRAMSALATEAFRQEEEWYQRTYGNRGNARTSISGTNRSTIAAGAGAAATTTATMIGATQTSNVTTQTSNVTTRAMAARHRAAANADKDSMSNHNTALPSSSSSSSSTTTTTTTSSSSNSSDMPGSTQRRRRMFPSRAVANEGGADGDDDDDDASASMEVEMTELDVRRRSAQHGAGLAPTRVGWGNIDQNGDMDGHDVRDGGDDGDDDGNWDSLDMRYMKPAARSGSNPSESFGSSSSSSSSSASSSSSSSSSSSARDVALATQMESKRVDDGDNAYGNAHGMDDRHYPTQQQRKSSLNDMMQGGFDDKGDDTMRGDDGMGESGSMDSTAVPTDVTEPTPLTHSEEELRAIKQQKDGWAIVTLLIGAGARPRIIRRFLPLPQAGQEAVQAGLFLQHRGRVSEFVDLLVAAGTAEAKVAMERVARHIADNIMSPRSAWTEASSTSVTQWPVEVLNLVAAYGCVPHVDDIDPRTGDVTWGKYCTAEARPPLLMGSGATGAGNPRAEVIDDDIPPMFKALLPCNDTCACHCHCRFCSDP